jgi:hypothetical protein
LPACPNFDLDPLESFDPSLLLGGKNSADAFVLLLALAFNDLKDANWTMQQLDKCKPDDVGQIDATIGQWHGMRIRFTRQVLGILNELLVAINSADRAGLLGDEHFDKAVGRCGPETQRAWSELVATATDQPSSSYPELRPYLDEVRNRAAFHYDRTRLWQGYEHHFVRFPQSGHNERAYMSLGMKMEGTRFYFADAAVHFAYALSDLPGARIKETDEMVLAMGKALRNIVETYIRVRAENQ